MNKNDQKLVLLWKLKRNKQTMGVSLLSPFRKRGKKDDITKNINTIKYVDKDLILHLRQME